MDGEERGGGGGWGAVGDVEVLLNSWGEKGPLRTQV